MKIGIIGLGAVGSASAFLLASKKIANSLFFYDVNKDLANAQKIDLEDAIFDVKINVVDDVSAMLECDLILFAFSALICANRVDELRANYDICKEICPKLSNFKGIILIATNPNDSIVFYAQKLSKLNPKKIFGTGTSLDTQRLRAILSLKLNISANNINAYMLAEHGDTMFFAQSISTILNKNIKDFFIDNNLEYDYLAIEKEVITRGADIFKVKNKTEYGISSTILRIISCIKNDEKKIFPLSVVEENLAYSYTYLLGKDGIDRKISLNLNEDDLIKLAKSKSYILKVINSIN
ncbi:hypothetical protein AVCANL279_07515 [Campylobacter canadensis]|uniref:lactate/malate family dehydrogenase n=1 Tax=Campylobacter canadensis TaxID=449520 RepID=UPI0015536D89|nr:hypothetical protein [Campylobacter canadensis]MBZ7995291.1 hypothetical protein [Campylobacter canadensis]MBZ7997167.1 hypothetical protein [Campylobacter canadensis]MBZ8000706.1 hypothetical protein [Campylobacter canadensis]MBZ8002497.1 hypothetical protein [Campylobacter canadensis]MBZ8003376.1 hypothetical protein [Campylobacter canadensis]